MDFRLPLRSLQTVTRFQVPVPSPSVRGTLTGATREIRETKPAFSPVVPTSPLLSSEVKLYFVSGSLDYSHRPTSSGAERVSDAGGVGWLRVWLVGWLVSVLVCAFVCAFVSAFVCSFRGLFACVLSWVEILLTKYLST